MPITTKPNEQRNQSKEIWIFLSHSNEDFNKVRLIRNYLEEKSFRPLMFYLKCLESEDETFDLITREIDARTRFILCDSENAKASKWVQKEMEYIKSKNKGFKRSYQVLDLSLPMESIMKEIDLYANQANIYVSYPRTKLHLCELVVNRLEKYDLNVYFADRDMSSDSLFAEQLHTQIKYAANNGYVISLFDKDSKWCRKELYYADELNANVILVTITEEDDVFCQKDYVLKKYPRVSVANVSETDKTDAIVLGVLEKVLPLGSLKTHADNFCTGKMGVKDEKESVFLYRQLLKEAEKSDNPYALWFIGECYEYGRGVSVDLRKAYECYALAVHDPLGPKDEMHISHLRQLYEKISL